MHHKINLTVAFTEVIIGAYSLIGLTGCYLFSEPKGPSNIYLFIIITSFISIIIGVGLFFSKDWARKLIIFFSSYVIFTKILLVSDIIQFNAEVVALPLVGAKNAISILYHTLTLFYFSSRKIEKYFK